MKFGRPHRGGGGRAKAEKCGQGGSKKVVFVRTSFMDAPKAL